MLLHAQTAFSVFTFVFRCRSSQRFLFTSPVCLLVPVMNSQLFTVPDSWQLEGEFVDERQDFGKRSVNFWPLQWCFTVATETLNDPIEERCEIQQHWNLSGICFLFFFRFAPFWFSIHESFKLLFVSWLRWQDVMIFHFRKLFVHFELPFRGILSHIVRSITSLCIWKYNQPRLREIQYLVSALTLW